MTVLARAAVGEDPVADGRFAWASGVRERNVEWLEPWHFADDPSGTFQRQLATEVKRGHPLHRVPVRLIARGDGDDCLFELLDGTSRVAVVHLVWQGPQPPPWPSTAIYASLEAWRVECMLPEHAEWADR